MLAAHGQSLASDSEALPESSKTCAIETEEIPTSERIQRLCNLKKYDEALALCNVYEVDPVSGKPFYGDSRHANIGGPHLLRSKILLASGRREECIEEARLAVYREFLEDQRSGPARKFLESLHVVVPEKMSFNTSKNQEVLDVVDRLVDFEAFPSQKDLEGVFHRPFFNTVYNYGSCDGSSLFPEIRTGRTSLEKFPNINAIDRKDGRQAKFIFGEIDYELACLTQADLEKHFGNGHYERDRSAIGRDSYIGEPAYVCFRRGDKTISFFFPSPPKKANAIRTFSIVWNHNVK